MGYKKLRVSAALPPKTDVTYSSLSPFFIKKNSLNTTDAAFNG
jgi:hypothetical protein